MIKIKHAIFFSLLSFATLLPAQIPPSIIRFLNQNAQAIALTDTTDFSDLKKLSRALRKKRMVLLGESTHGAKEINLLKNRLIRYLHQKLGFKVLLLESGIGEIYSLNFDRDQLAGQEMLFAGLMGPWQSKEFLPLMAYLKAHPDLQVAGFDVQRTGQSFQNILLGVDSVINPENDLSLVTMEERFSALRSKLTNGKIVADEQLGAEYRELVATLQQAIPMIDRHRHSLLKAGWNDQQISLVVRSLQNRIDFVRYYYQFKLDNDYVKRFAFRDSVMAANVLWLANTVYPNEKIIISGHNHHISRYNERDFVMGEKLAEEFGDKLYAIGLFPGKGSFANNARVSETIENTGAADDLQNIILQSTQSCTFLPIPKKKKSGSDWLFQPITINNTFINIWGDKQLTLSQSFDALIFLREISPAEY